MLGRVPDANFDGMVRRDCFLCGSPIMVGNFYMYVNSSTNDLIMRERTCEACRSDNVRTYVRNHRCFWDDDFSMHCWIIGADCRKWAYDSVNPGYIAYMDLFPEEVEAAHRFLARAGRQARR